MPELRDYHDALNGLAALLLDAGTSSKISILDPLVDKTLSDVFRILAWGREQGWTTDDRFVLPGDPE